MTVACMKFPDGIPKCVDKDIITLDEGKTSIDVKVCIN